MKPKILFIASLVLFLLAPSLSLAATSSVPTSQQALITQLTQELAQLQSQLDALIAGNTAGGTAILTSTSTPVTIVSVPVTTSVSQINGNLRITFRSFEKLQTPNSLASTSPLNGSFGEFLLDYSACPTTFCVSPKYPTMHTELWPGQSTNYLNQTITLSGFDTTTTTQTAQLVVTSAN